MPAERRVLTPCAYERRDNCHVHTAAGSANDAGDFGAAGPAAVLEREQLAEMEGRARRHSWRCAAARHMWAFTQQQEQVAEGWAVRGLAEARGCKQWQ